MAGQVNVGGVCVTKEEAVIRLRAAGHARVADELEAWRDIKGNNWGWDGWIRKAHPHAVEIIWPDVSPALERRVIPGTLFVLSDYIESALDQAEYEKLEDGSYSGSIPVCPGVIAFAGSLKGCERELRSVLEDWLLLGLKLGHHLPVIGGIDLNRDMTHAEVESV